MQRNRLGWSAKDELVSTTGTVLFIISVLITTVLGVVTGGNGDGAVWYTERLCSGMQN